MSGRSKPVPESVDVELTKSLQRWHAGATIFYVLLAACVFILSFIHLSTRRQEDIQTDFGGTVSVLSTYAIFAPLLGVPIVAFFYHLLMWVYPNTIGWILATGINPYRWLEFAITTALIYWTVLIISAKGCNVFLLTASLAASIAQFIFLYFFEKNFKAWLPRWRSLMGAYLLFALFWVTSIIYYVNTTPASHPTYDAIALFGGFAFSFLIMLVPIYMLMWRPSVSAQSDEFNYQIELIYIVLSIAFKTIVLLAITIGDF